MLKKKFNFNLIDPLSHLKYMSFFFNLIFFFNRIPILRADLSPEQLKGTYSILHPQYQDFSILHGYTLINQGTLSHLHQWGNENDETVKLIKNIFQLTAGNFAVTNLSSNPVRYFTKETVALLLARLSLVEENELKDEKSRQLLNQELQDLIWAEIGTGGTKNKWAKEQRNRYQAVTSPLMQRACENPSNPSVSLAEIPLAPILIALDNSLKQSVPLKNEIKKKKVEEFVHQLMKAMMECRKEGSPYPARLAEQTLLALFSKLSNSREDIYELFETMPWVLSGKKLPRKDDWIKDQFSAEDYRLLKQKVMSLQSNDSTYFLQNPETYVFFQGAFNKHDQKLPPLLPFARAAHSSLQNEPVKENRLYPDCGENSARNFFRIIRKFNPHFLTDIPSNSPLSPKKTLKDFYQKYEDLIDIEHQAIRDEWGEMVISGTAGATFNKPSQAGVTPVCDLRGGMDNMLTVMHELLFNGQYSKWKKLTSSEQWDVITKALSRPPDFILEWEEKKGDRKKVDDQNDNLQIVFSVNKEPLFEWSFYPRHFQLSALSDEKLSWKSEFENQIRAKLMQNNSPWSSIELSMLVNTFIHTKFKKIDFPQFVKKAGPTAEYIFSHLLNDENTRYHILEKVHGHRIDFLYPLSKRIIEKLPRNDQFTQMLVTSLYMVADHPDLKSQQDIWINLAMKEQDRMELFRTILDSLVISDMEREYLPYEQMGLIRNKMLRLIKPTTEEIRSLYSHDYLQSFLLTPYNHDFLKIFLASITENEESYSLRIRLLRTAESMRPRPDIIIQELQNSVDKTLSSSQN